ncbi:MAG: hypothetical protein RMK18_08245 [Armatimonadota bacterium]|nr:hypothetical protein [Armatimonadota bacterium]
MKPSWAGCQCCTDFGIRHGCCSAKRFGKPVGLPSELRENRDGRLGGRDYAEPKRF